MILLFVEDTIFFVQIAENISKYYRNCEILAEYNQDYFDRATIIIPVGINAQKKLMHYTRYRNKFLISDSLIYDILDDKINFYDFIDTNNMLIDSPIKLIRTYDDYYKKDFEGQFIVKHRRGAGSAKNKIITGSIQNIIRKYSPDCQIQDLLKVKYIDCVSCLCKNGDILRSLNFRVHDFISRDLYKTDHKLFLKRTKSMYMEVMSKIVKRLKYNGLIEFEFLVDKNKNIYIIEANPRISGTIFTYIEKNSPYVNDLINSYCNLIVKHGFDATNYEGTYELNYYKKKSPKYKICDCGLVKIIK